MFAYISGLLAEIENQRVVIDVQGIGYSILVPNSVLGKLPPIGGKIKLFTYFQVREDGQELYGFLDKEEKYFFEKLLSVSGIGPKVAIAILSVLSPKQIAVAIFTGDFKTLSSAPGIGKKTAERMILELKDKIAHEDIQWQDNELRTVPAGERSEALEALMALGYEASDAQKAIGGVAAAEQDPSVIIRLALKNLDNRRR